MATVDIQRATESLTPTDDEFRRWVDLCIPETKNTSEISIRIVDKEEGRQLNFDYRQKDYPTNVLSFPCDLPDDITIPLLGDIVICAPVVEQEASDQRKEIKSHWAHMTIHGTLHLLGYDHIEDSDAAIMEKLETDILIKLGYSAPYSDH